MMDEQGEEPKNVSAAIHEKVMRILKSRKSRSRKAELIVAVLLGFWDIVGVAQDAGPDRPFDLRDDDGGVRIDVKTQRGGVLDVKKEKVAKQFLAWSRSGGFLPMQVVLDARRRAGTLWPASRRRRGRPWTRWTRSSIPRIPPSRSASASVCSRS